MNCKQKLAFVSADALLDTVPDDPLRSVKQSLLTRSNSLDKLYYHSNKKNDTLKSLFPPSGYDDTDSDNDDDNYDGQQVHLLRSFTVGSKHITHHREIWKLSETATSTNGRLPDATHASKKPPLLAHEIRISNENGAIYAITTRGPILVVATGHYNIQTYNIKHGFDTLFNSFSSTTATAVMPCYPQESANAATDSIRSLCFSPAMRPNDANYLVWAGTENGSILAMNVQSNQVIVRKMAAHSQSIAIMLRHRNLELWTIDDGGNLNIWPISTMTATSSNDCSNNADINASETATLPQKFTVTKNPKTAILSPTKPRTLWLSSGRSIDKFDGSFVVPVIEMPTELGDITQLFTMPFHTNQILAAHVDGQISVWDETTFERISYVTVTMDKLTAVAVVGAFYLWVGFHNGKVAIYDTRCEPWTVVKIWKAHKNAVVKVTVDEFSIVETMMPVISIDSAGHIAIWDGFMEDYWLEGQLTARLVEYCDFDELKTMICSWNMDAIKPDALTDADVEKVYEWLNGMSDPDIIMVGIQEIADLNSKILTAKSFLSLNRKIETIEEADELLTHRYMLWHDYLISVIDSNFGKNTYKTIKTDQMMGLFSCIFIKTTLEDRIYQCDSNVVKTGFRLMNKSLHGNKGGIATRLIIDDTSICFVNCHLAAGQSNVLTRNVDIEGILHSARFPLPLLLNDDERQQEQAFKPDSDGTNILDHEVCFLSGDLNYRISDIKREQVLALLADSSNKFEVWETLQQHDQLKKQLAHNPMFRQLGFKEPPILFDPTYKYDQGTDCYDRSEKKRIPAWCDRILHRGPTSMSNIYYRRHELKASDHRPISAGFTIHAKTVCQERLQHIQAQLALEWQQMLLDHLHENKIRHVTYYNLCDEKEALARLEKADWDVEYVVMALYRDKGGYFV